MVFTSAPKGFSPRFTVVTCYIEYSGKFLLMQRNDDKVEGGKWGVPGGKLEKGETEPAALARELQEEIGLEVAERELNYLGKVFVRFPDYDFEFSMFSLKLDRDREVMMNAAEHQAYKWATLEEALSLNLIRDNDVCLRMMADLQKEISA